MTEKKSAGIKLHNVFVTKLDFEVFPDRVQKKAVNLAIGVDTKFSELTKLEERLTVTITTDEDLEKTYFRLVVSVLGYFEEQPDGAALTLEKFSTLQAPAILFPYVREAVTSITAKAPMAPILLPPMNLAFLIQNGKGQTTAEI